MEVSFKLYLAAAAHRDDEDEGHGGEGGQQHRHHHHVEPLPGEHGDQLGADLAARADEDLVVGGELGLVQLAGVVAGPRDGRHREVVRREVVQVGQLRLRREKSVTTAGKVRLNKVITPILAYQVEVRGVGGADIYPPLVVAVIQRRLVVKDEVVNLAVDQFGAPPLHQDVSIP